MAEESCDRERMTFQKVSHSCGPPMNVTFTMPHRNERSRSAQLDFISDTGSAKLRLTNTAAGTGARRTAPCRRAPHSVGAPPRMLERGKASKLSGPHHSRENAAPPP